MWLQVWRTCLLDNGERANIITFYNEVFMPRFKDYILHWVGPAIRALPVCAALTPVLPTPQDGGHQRNRPPLSPLPLPRRGHLPTSPQRKTRVCYFLLAIETTVYQ